MKVAELLSSPLVQFVLGRYQTLNHRDQVAVRVLATFFSVLFIYSVLIQPLQSYSSSAKRHYEKNAQDLIWMKANSPSRSAVMAKRGANESLLGLASTSAKKYYINFKRYESLDEGALRVNLDRVLFKNLVLWLEFLEKNYGVKVSKITIDQQETPAYVNARIVLKG